MTPEQKPAKVSFHLDKCGTRQESQLPTYFRKRNFKPGQAFHFRITQIYDPSKFWIVEKFRELEIYQNHLFKSYYINRSKYRMPLNKVEKDMYCVVFIDGAFYRALIVGFPCSEQQKPEVQVYCIDYGSVSSVDPANIYYMNSVDAKVPQFVIRATLAGICPRRSHQWSADDVAAFYSLVCDKIFIGVVKFVDYKRQVIEIQFKEHESLSPSIHETLISQKRARYFDEEPEISENKTNIETKLKYSYLFPCHEAIEGGKVPTSLSDENFQAEISPFSPIVGRYYTQKNQKA